MKKLLIFGMLMGIVTAVNAQTSITERDIFTEQVINSVSSFKFGSEKILFSSAFHPELIVVNGAVPNPFQYVQQPADFISIASTAYGLMIYDAGESDDLGSVDLVLEINTGANVWPTGKEGPECDKKDKIKS